MCVGITAQSVMLSHTWLHGPYDGVAKWLLAGRWKHRSFCVPGRSRNLYVQPQHVGRLGPGPLSIPAVGYRGFFVQGSSSRNVKLDCFSLDVKLWLQASVVLMAQGCHLFHTQNSIVIVRQKVITWTVTVVHILEVPVHKLYVRPVLLSVSDCLRTGRLWIDPRVVRANLCRHHCFQAGFDNPSAP
jgi:hypothetical protein